MFLLKKKFSFTSNAVKDDTFAVASFSGLEAISAPYHFEIQLISDDGNIDPLAVLENTAKFTIHRDTGESVEFNGILKQFEEAQEVDGYYFFTAVLVPKLWWLSLTHHNQVFLDKTIPEIMTEALKDGGLHSGIDFELKLQGEEQIEPYSEDQNIDSSIKYLKHEYICQYGESHFNFISRLAEREGIYYYFEQTANGEKIVFTDHKMTHSFIPISKKLIYTPPSGLDSMHLGEVINTFLCKHNLLPQRIHLKDYNYRKPSLAVEGMADIDKNGRGENYIYGEHFRSPEEGNRLATIRSEELLCRKSVFHGKSSVPFMVSGFIFDLKSHYKDAYNREYLISGVHHDGHQTGYLIAGLRNAIPPRQKQMSYANTFTAIYSDIQFRPDKKTIKPKISGTINARIDGATSGEYAELDAHGRYKVTLPFDRSGRHSGKASACLRMMQPLVGPNQGMHFPLHKGTEVMLSFVDGDPDRPFIVGAVPNPETPNVVNRENQTKSIIATGKNRERQTASDDAANNQNSNTPNETVINYLEFEDKTGSEGIRLHSTGNNWQESQDRYADYITGGPVNKSEIPGELQYLWEKLYEAPDGASEPAFAPTGMKTYGYPDYEGSTTPTADEHKEMKLLAQKAQVELVKGDSVNIREGNIYDFGGYRTYNLRSSYTENHLNPKAELNTTAEKTYNEKDQMSYDRAKSGGPGQDITCMGLDDSGALKAEETRVKKNIGGSYYNYQNNTKTMNVMVNTREENHIYSHTVDKYKYYKKTGILKKKVTESTGEDVTEEYDESGIPTFTQIESGSNTKTFSYSASSSSDFIFSEKASFSFIAAAKQHFTVVAAHNTGVNINLSAIPPFELTFGVPGKTKIGIETGLTLEAFMDLGFKLELSNGKFKFSGPGTEAETEAALKASLQTLLLKETKLRLQKEGIELTKKDVDLKSASIKLQEGTQINT